MDSSGIYNETLTLSNNSSGFENFSIEEFLLAKLGPKQRDLTSVIFLFIIYSLIFVSGTVGNTCTCLVIVRNNYMQTSTNYYLFSLAISDILILIFGLPYEAYSIYEAYPWRFGEPFCIFKSLIMEITSYASILTITAFTVERYLAVCFPLKSHKIANLRRSVKIIILIWAISFLCALPYPIHTRAFYSFSDRKTGLPLKESYICNIPKKVQNRMIIIFQFSTFIFFVLPMTVITVLYILITITLRRTALNRANSEDSQKNGHTSHSMKVVLRMLVAVVVAFFVCWAPFHAQRLYTLYNIDWTHFELEVQSHLFYISGVLYFFGSTVNPILYNVMSKRYRQAFKETLCRCFLKRSTRDQRSLVYYHNYMKTAKRQKSNRLKTMPSWHASGYENYKLNNSLRSLDNHSGSNYNHSSIHSRKDNGDYYSLQALNENKVCESPRFSDERSNLPAQNLFSKSGLVDSIYTAISGNVLPEQKMIKYKSLSKSDNVDAVKLVGTNLYSCDESYHSADTCTRV